MGTVYSWNINYSEFTGFFGFSGNCSYRPFPLRNHITVLLVANLLNKDISGLETLEKKLEHSVIL